MCSTRLDHAIARLELMDTSGAAALLAAAVASPVSPTELSEALELLPLVAGDEGLDAIDDSRLCAILRNHDVERQNLSPVVWPRILDALGSRACALDDRWAAALRSLEILDRSPLFNSAIRSILVDDPDIEDVLRDLRRWIDDRCTPSTATSPAVERLLGGIDAQIALGSALALPDADDKGPNLPDFCGAPQRQYDLAPYPQWNDLPVLHRRTFATWLRVHPMLVSIAASPHLPERPRALVAGCGTGRHALRLARRTLDTQIVGVDLSSRSLQTALAHTQRFDDVDVTLLQGDVMHLPFADDAFDVVECVGVLHHLREPGTAIAELARVLRPGGVMCIGVYSTMARTDVRAARAAAGSPNDVAASRERIRRLDRGSPGALVMASPDFYTVSGFIDLIHPAAERDFTPSALARLLAASELTPWAFEVDHPALADVARQLHTSGLNLVEIFDQLEAALPEAFSGMFRVWLS